MTYSVLVSEAASTDALVIYHWYEEKLAGLGLRFIASLETAKTDLLKNPLAFAQWKKGIRRMVMRKFPYKIFYKVYETEIVVLAIVHARRSNRYLKKKL